MPTTTLPCSARPAGTPQTKPTRPWRLADPRKVIGPASSADPECWLSGAGLAGPGLLELADKAQERLGQSRNGRAGIEPKHVRTPPAPLRWPACLFHRNRHKSYQLIWIIFYAGEVYLPRIANGAIAPAIEQNPDPQQRVGTQEKTMKTMILAAAAVIALGVGVAGSAFAEGEGGSATGAVQWRQADSSTAPATNADSEAPARLRPGAVPRLGRQRPGLTLPSAQAVAGPAGGIPAGFSLYSRFRRGGPRSFRHGSGSAEWISRARWTSNPANR